MSFHSSAVPHRCCRSVFGLGQQQQHTTYPGSCVSDRADLVLVWMSGTLDEEQALRLAAEGGLNEKAFAEALRSPATAELASSLAAACRCSLLSGRLMSPQSALVIC